MIATSMDRVLLQQDTMLQLDGFPDISISNSQHNLISLVPITQLIWK